MQIIFEVKSPSRNNEIPKEKSNGKENGWREFVWPKRYIYW